MHIYIRLSTKFIIFELVFFCLFVLSHLITADIRDQFSTVFLWITWPTIDYDEFMLRITNAVIEVCMCTFWDVVMHNCRLHTRITMSVANGFDLATSKPLQSPRVSHRSGFGNGVCVCALCLPGCSVLCWKHIWTHAMLLCNTLW